MGQVYNLQVIALDEKDGLANTATSRYSLTEDDKFAVVQFGVDVQEYASASATPYNQLTEAEVAGWVTASIDLSQFTASLIAQINYEPPKDAPWQ